MYIDDEVIELIRKGDEFVFQCFYYTFAPMLYNKIRSRIDSRLDAEDLVQDIMASMPEILNTNKEINGKNIIFYLISITNKEIYRYNRKLKNNNTIIEVEYDEDYEYRFMPREMIFDIEELVKVLNKLEYNVLTMKYVDKLNYQEITESLDGCSERTIRRIMKRSLAKVKKYINKKYRI